MAFKVIMDGKPCSGKTTLSRALETALPKEYGISALDAKAYAMEKGTFSLLLRKFTDGEIDTYKALAYSAVRHSLSYLALEESAWENRNKYDVLILQRSPYAFSFMLEAVKNAAGDTGSHEISGMMYGIIRAWAAAVKPDLLIYLDADVETLRERFKDRTGGRDRIHARMIEEDDSRHRELLKSYMRNGFKVIENNSNIEESTRAAASLIYQAYSKFKARAGPARSDIKARKA